MKLSGLLICSVLLSAIAANADTVITSYNAFIGPEDRLNSHGERITLPYQILQQDRANIHRFHISQPGDQSDPYFGDAEARSHLRDMVENGHLDDDAAQILRSASGIVTVTVYGESGFGSRVNVSVWHPSDTRTVSALNGQKPEGKPDASPPPSVGKSNAPISTPHAGINALSATVDDWRRLSQSEKQAMASQWIQTASPSGLAQASDYDVQLAAIELATCVSAAVRETPGVGGMKAAEMGAFCIIQLSN